MSSLFSDSRRPLIKNTYGKKIHTEQQVNDTQAASVDSPGAYDDDYLDDLDLSKSLLAPKRREIFTDSPQMLLDPTQVIAEDDEDDHLDDEPPLTPRSKLKAQLSQFDNETPSPTKKAIVPTSKNPFQLIDEESDEELENDGESEEAFLNRFRNKFLSQKKSDEPDATLADTSSLYSPITAPTHPIERVDTNEKTTESSKDEEPNPSLEKTINHFEADMDDISDDSDDEVLFANTTSQVKPATSPRPEVAESEEVDSDAIETQQTNKAKKVSFVLLPI